MEGGRKIEPCDECKYFRLKKMQNGTQSIETKYRNINVAMSYVC